MGTYSIQKYTFIIIFATLVTAYFGLRMWSDLTFDNAPPVVIQTFPVAGDDNVDPLTHEIRVVFSKPMMTEKMYSLVRLNGDTFPELNGKAHFLDDERTCIIPVKLEPDKTYALWLNKGQWNSFRDSGNQPAIPYLLSFKTGKQ